MTCFGISVLGSQPSVQLLDYERCQNAENGERYHYSQENGAPVNIEGEEHKDFTSVRNQSSQDQPLELAELRAMLS